MRTEPRRQSVQILGWLVRGLVVIVHKPMGAVELVQDMSGRPERAFDKTMIVGVGLTAYMDISQSGIRAIQTEAAQGFENLP